MTPTLSQLPLPRLAPLRRLPFWAQALALCALFAIAGVAIVDDYGTHVDVQRQVAIANAAYIATGDISVLSQAKDIAYRYYGLAFEMPLLLAERALGLQDTRHIYLTRHLLTHLFFIAGGFVCGMLAYRMLGSRWIALFAMLIFLLHPRLYAHSFFNSKDDPFAVMLLIALYLAHRAFRRDTLGAFLMCGVVVGLAINMRPFALMLLPLIPALRAPDLWRASGEERKRVLIVSAAFLAAAIATAYITHPYYWENPLRFIDGVREMSQHPVIAENLFMGEIYLSDAVPWNFIPVWFAITAPPVALALGAVGCAATCWRAITRPLAALLDRETRFGIMLLGCIALPVAVAIILQSNIYNGWRQMYFLWAPFCLLAAIGLRALAGGGAGECARVGVTARLPEWVRGGNVRLHTARRALAYGVAGAGLLTTLTAMAALHPHQQVYFNALVDTKTPGALGERYDMDYNYVAERQLLEHLLARYPDATLRVWPGQRSALILPSSDRERIVFAARDDADFYLRSNPGVERQRLPDQLAHHSIQAYGSVIAYILAPNSDAHRAYYRAAYSDAAASGTLLTRADFDIYVHNGDLIYLKENCGPLTASAGSSVFLHIFPADPADLPPRRHEFGFENRDFLIIEYSGFLDGKCILTRSLPDYPIARIRTGQNAAAHGGDEWRADIDFAAHAAAQALYEGIVAGDYGPPVAQSHFDIYLSDKALTYLKIPCAPGDTHARFFLHITPINPTDLPTPNRELGFANLDFHFADHGAYAGDICVATRDMPDYAIERIRTGQFVSGVGNLWRAEFPAAR